MPTFRIAFLVQNGRELDPQLDFRGCTLAKLDIASPGARAELREELGSIDPEGLEVDGYIPTVPVDIEAEDEQQALLAGFHQATLSLAPYSLIVPEKEMIDFSRHSPVVLPRALLLDTDAEPPTGAFRYQHGPSLARFNVGEETVSRTKSFNDAVVRRIAALYPESLLKADEERCSLALRIARAVHWYSQGEAESEPVMAFVCYWIGLEALALKSSTSASKRKTLVNRMALLARRHGGGEWAKMIGELWDKRSDIVHEGFGATQTGLVPEITASDLNEVKYLFFIAVLYAVEQHGQQVPLEKLWHPRHRDSYAPSVTADPAEFPDLWQVLDHRRSFVSASG